MPAADPTPEALAEALRLIRGAAEDLDLRGCHVAICTPCLDGAGGECHTPGCLFWICAAPDIPIRERAEDSNGYHIAVALDAAEARGRARAIEEAARVCERYATARARSADTFAPDDERRLWIDLKRSEAERCACGIRDMRGPR